MGCDDVRAELLDGSDHSEAIRAHLLACAGCARAAERTARLDALLARSVVLEPPAALQAQLASIALAAAHPAPVAAPARVTWIQPLRRLFGPMALAHAAVLLMLALAGRRVVETVEGVQPMLGNVGYAIELISTSPALFYLGDAAGNGLSLLGWGAAGVAAVLVALNRPARSRDPLAAGRRI